MVKRCDCALQGPAGMVRAASLALQGNAVDLRKEFPLATIRIEDAQGKPLHTRSAATPANIVACCPASMRNIIQGRIQQAIQAVQVGTASLDVSSVNAATAARLADSTKLDEFAAELRSHFQCCILLTFDAAKQHCVVATLRPLVPAVEAHLRALLGLPAKAPAQPLAAAPLPHEQRALQAVLVSVW